MINDILNSLEKITFQGWLAIWLIIFLFMALNKLSAYADAKIELMKQQAEAERVKYENSIFERRNKP